MDYSEVLNVVFTPLFLKALPIQSDIASIVNNKERNSKLLRELYRLYRNTKHFFFMLKMKRKLKI